MKYIRFTEINAGGYGENATLVIKVKTNDAVIRRSLKKLLTGFGRKIRTETQKVLLQMPVKSILDRQNM